MDILSCSLYCSFEMIAFVFDVIKQCQQLHLLTVHFTMYLHYTVYRVKSCTYGKGIGIGFAMETVLPTPLQYLWVQIEPLQGVYHQRVLCKPVIHDQVESLQERRCIDEHLEIGIIQTLQRKMMNMSVNPNCVLIL